MKQKRIFVGIWVLSIILVISPAFSASPFAKGKPAVEVAQYPDPGNCC